METRKDNKRILAILSAVLFFISGVEGLFDAVKGFGFIPHTDIALQLVAGLVALALAVALLIGRKNMLFTALVGIRLLVKAYYAITTPVTYNVLSFLGFAVLFFVVLLSTLKPAANKARLAKVLCVVPAILLLCCDVIQCILLPYSVPEYMALVGWGNLSLLLAVLFLGIWVTGAAQQKE